MAKTSIGVRFSEAQLAGLKQIADTADVDVSDLIRWAVGALIEHAKRNGGRIMLPLDFSESYESRPMLRAAEEPEKYKGKRRTA